MPKLFVRILAVVALIAVASLSFQAMSGSFAIAAGSLPCDIYASGGTPCVAAHSTVRALFSAYSGNLYQVKRASDSTTSNIGVLSAGGFANAAAQDTFCAGTTCTITIIYDQSGRGNDLTPAPPGGNKNTPDNPANATALPITVSGHKAYGVWIDAGMGYRRDSTSGIATGDTAETEYMVTSGTHFNAGCCFDYGNAETNNNDDGAGTMEAVFFGNIKAWTFGAGNGPWVMADLENGLFGCSASPNGSLCSNDPTITNPFVTAMVKGHSGNSLGLKEGNAQSGGLTTFYNGVRPSGYSPMKKQGAIILGIGGDNSNSSIGSFYEGVMVTGDPSDATDDAVQASIVAAGYGTGPTLTPTPPTPTSIPSTNPIVQYNFDGNTNDSSGNGKNATAVNGPTFVTGKIGQAINIAAGTQYVSVPNNILSGVQNFSIDTWVKVTANANWARVFDFGSSTNSYMFLAPQSGSGNLRYAITVSGNGSEQQINGPSALTTGVWHNVAVTLSGMTGTLYVDGAQVGQNTSMTLNPSSLGATVANFIGKSQFSADPDLNGAVDQFNIYNRALSAAEVQTLWNNGGPTPTPTFAPPTNTPGTITPPVVWYKFDGNANDSSGNGKNGTLQGSPTFITGKNGQAVRIAGGSQFVSVPTSIVSSLTNFSISAWVNVTTNANWARLFDFGSNTTTYMFLAPQSGSGTLRYAITTSGNGAEQQLNGTSALSTGVWHHVVVTLSGNTGTLYVDGAQVAQNTGMTLHPSSLGATSNGLIGKSQFTADPNLNGAVDQFEIYNYALTAAQVQQLFQNP